MTAKTRPLLMTSAIALTALALLAAVAVRAADDKPTPVAAVKPALTVTATQAQTADLPLAVHANGNIAAWQEASVGAEAQGLRLEQVKVNVGDRVKRGDLLASFATDVVQADLAQVRAAVAEAEAMLAEAASNAQRARDLSASGALSAQQISQYLTAERTAQARLLAQRAAAQVQEVRLRQTQVRAPDDGVISARGATVGAVVPAGAELFRLIRQGRLEWRAEVAATDLAKVRVGATVRVQPSGAAPLNGRVRKLAPTVDPATRNGIVYVDLATQGDAKAGMFARGEFAVGQSTGLTLPQAAVQLRDGFSYVFALGADQRVTQTKVEVGRRVGERIEIKAGLAAGTRVVASGVGFLADGDLVRVVDAAGAAGAAK